MKDEAQASTPVVANAKKGTTSKHNGSQAGSPGTEPTKMRDRLAPAEAEKQVRLAASVIKVPQQVWYVQRASRDLIDYAADEFKVQNHDSVKS